MAVTLDLPLDDNSGVTAFDISGNGYDGTLTNGATWSTVVSPNASFTHSVIFDGTNDFIAIPTMNASAPIGLGTNDFTMLIRAKMTTNQSCVLAQHAVRGVGTHSGWMIYWYQPGSTIYFFVFIAGVQYETVSFGWTYDNSWHDWGVTRKGDFFTMYKDGIAVDFANATLTIPLPARSGELSDDGDGGSVTAQPFAGNLSDFRIYVGDAFSSQEVATYSLITSGPSDPWALISSSVFGVYYYSFLASFEDILKYPNPISTTPSNTPLPHAFGANVTTGNLLTIAIATYFYADATCVPSDGLGNTYTQAGTYVTNGLQRLSLWWCKSAFSGANTVTFTANHVDLDITAVANEYSGVWSGAPFDTVVHNQDNGSTMTTTAVGVQDPSNLVIAVFAQPDGTRRTLSVGGSAGFLIETGLTNAVVESIYYLDKTARTTALQTATMTFGASMPYVAIITTFLSEDFFLPELIVPAKGYDDGPALEDETMKFPFQEAMGDTSWVPFNDFRLMEGPEEEEPEDIFLPFVPFPGGKAKFPLLVPWNPDKAYPQISRLHEELVAQIMNSFITRFRFIRFLDPARRVLDWDLGYSPANPQAWVTGEPDTVWEALDILVSRANNPVSPWTVESNALNPVNWTPPPPTTILEALNRLAAWTQSAAPLP